VFRSNTQAIDVFGGERIAPAGQAIDFVLHWPPTLSRQSDLPADLLALARALTQRRLLVAKLASEATTATEG